MGKKKYDSLGDILTVLDDARSSEEKGKKKKKNKKKHLGGAGIPASTVEFDGKFDKKSEKGSDIKSAKTFEDKKHELILENIRKEIEDMPAHLLSSTMENARNELEELREDVKGCKDINELEDMRNRIEENELRVELIREVFSKKKDEYNKWLEKQEAAKKERIRENAKQDLEVLKERYGQELLKELVA